MLATIVASLVFSALSANNVGAVTSPVIDSVSPAGGMVYGGDTVTIMGSDFDEGAVVYFDGVVAMSTTWVDANTVTVTTPAGIAGTVDVRLVNGDGGAVNIDEGFLYEEAELSISSVTPVVGPSVGGQTVTIEGGGFTHGVRKASRVSGGNNHSCGIYEEKAYCWGYNGSNQLGNGSNKNSNIPVAVNAAGALEEKNILSISSGGSHSCAVSSDGNAYCWGNNGNGQLGNSSLVSSDTPVAVSRAGGISSRIITSISAGSNHTCVVTSDGGAYCWGYNGNGQLGNGLTTGSTIPVAVNKSGVLSGKSVVSISVGSNYTCATTSDGGAYCWGYNGSDGQLGNGSTAQSLTPVAVNINGVLSGKSITSISAGNNHTCATTSDGGAYCWGSNSNGQLGNNSTSRSMVPVAVNKSGVLLEEFVVSVSAGSSHTCATTSDGGAYCWGSNGNGQLGNNSTVRSTVPVAVSITEALTGRHIASISAANSHTCAVTLDGRIYCWGNNGNGQLGDDSTAPAHIPTATKQVIIKDLLVLFGDKAADSVQILSPTTLTAVTPDSISGITDINITRYDSQMNTFGTSYEFIAEPIITGLSPSDGLISGGDTVTVTGSGFTDGIRVKIADSYVNDQNITLINDATLTFIAPANLISEKVDVSVEDIYGQISILKNGYNYIDLPMAITDISPNVGPSVGGQTVTISGDNFSVGLQKISQISTGGSNSCGIYEGRAYCWGSNTVGQLGDGTRINSNTPKAVDATGVLDGKTITQISVGSAHICAIASDGGAYCWGNNSNGQLGNGSTIRSDVPVAVGSVGSAYTTISVGDSFTCATTVTERAYCWGYNGDGRLGNNSTAQRTTPGSIYMSGVLSGKTIKSISSGYRNACVIASDDQLYCWGLGNNGALGNNSTNQSSIPMAIYTDGVLEDKTIKTVSAGTDVVCVIASDNKAYCWGNGTQGALGRGSTAQSNVPVAVSVSGVLADKDVLAISVGHYYVCATASDYKVYCWGSGNGGQLGNGSTSQSNVPTSVDMDGVMDGKKVVSVSSAISSLQSCATTLDGYAYCWGQNSNGQLGNGTNTVSYVPVAVDQIGIDDLIIYFNGIQATNVSIQSRTQVVADTPPGDAGITDISATRYDGNQTVLSASYEYIAQPTVASVTPNKGLLYGGDTIILSGEYFTEGMKVKLNNTYVDDVTYINSNTLSFTSPASAYARNVDIAVEDIFGQMYNMTNGFRYTDPDMEVENVEPNSGPSDGGQIVTITGDNFTVGIKDISEISSGENHTCGIYEGDAYCWGANNTGQLGDNTTTRSLVPVAVYAEGVLSGKSIVSISAGGNHTCAIASDGNAYCWGNNGSGQLGNNTTAQSLVPTAVYSTGVLSGKPIVSISAGVNSNTCAVTSDGRAYCWGYNGNGQLGNNSTAQSIVPAGVNITGVLSGKFITSVSTGSQHTCAVASDKKAYCWGYNNNGQLGDNSTTDSRVPVAVFSDGVLFNKDVSFVTTGANHSCALTSDGQVYCWGYNGNGQLGINSTAQRNAPAALTTMGGMGEEITTSVAASGYFTCALTLDQQVYCWGQNNAGQLGNDTRVGSNFPVEISANGDLAEEVVTHITAGSYHACAITLNRQAHCWGQNNSGQLGNESTTISNVPTLTNSVVNRNILVFFGGVAATGVQVVSPTTLSAIVPQNNPGVTDMQVTRYDDQTKTMSNAYSYLAGPGESYATPNSGLIMGGDTITITGGNFTSETKVKLGDNYIDPVTFVNDTTLSFITPTTTQPGAFDITIEDTYGQTYVIENGFSYRLPNISIGSISPRAGPQSGGEEITIIGSGFVNKEDGGAWYTVKFGETSASSVQYIDDTTLKVIIPSHAPGTVDVSVGSPYSNTVTLPNEFLYTADNYIFINTPLRISATQPGKMTIQARNTAGQAVVSTTDTEITLSSTSVSGSFAWSLSDNSPDAWNRTSVTLPAGQSSVEVWYKDDTVGKPIITGSIREVATFTQQQEVISPYRFLVTGVSDPIVSGVPSSITVRVTDYAGNPRVDYLGSFKFTSTDLAAILPGEYTMTESDYGIKTFTNGVTMRTQGTFCVSATDIEDAIITGSQCGISVSPPNTGTITKLNFINPTQRVSADSYSAPLTVQTQGADGRAIPVAEDTQIYFYSNSSSGGFSADTVNWSESDPLAVTIPAGSSSINVYFRDNDAKTSLLSVRDLESDSADGSAGDFAWTNATQNIITGLGPPEKIAIAGASTILLDQKNSYSLSLQDINGNLVSATSDITFMISSDTSSTQLFYPASSSTPVYDSVLVTIPTGQSQASFSLRDSISSPSGNMTMLSISDTRPVGDPLRIQDTSLDVLVIPGYAERVALSVDSSSVIANEVVGVTLQLRTDTNVPTSAASNTSFLLTNTSQSGEYSIDDQDFQPITSVQFSRGVGSIKLYYKDTKSGNRQLNATRSGYISTSASVNVLPSTVVKFGIAPQSSTVPIHTSSNAHTVTMYDEFGNVSTESINRTVYLYSDQASLAFASSSSGPWNQTAISIPAGQSSAQFYVKDTSFHESPVKITASDKAVIDEPDVDIGNGTSLMSIVSQPIANIVVTTPARTVMAGQVSDAVTVELRKADGSPAIQKNAITINVSVNSGQLFSSLDEGAEPISTLRFEAGQASGSMYYKGTKTGSFVMMAKVSDQILTTQAVTVQPSDVSKLSFVGQPQSVKVGLSSDSIVVTLTDDYGNLAPVATSTSVVLASSCSTGVFSQDGENWQSEVTVTVPENSSSFSFYYKDTVSNACDLTATSQGLSSATIPISITVNVTRFSLTPSATQTPLDTSSPAFTITMYDMYGDVTTLDADITVYLYSDQSTTQFSLSSSGPWDKTSVVIPAHQPSAQFYVKDSAFYDEPLTIAASDKSTLDDPDEAIVNGISNLTITSQPISDINIVTPEHTIIAGGVSEKITINLLKEDGSPAIQSGMTSISLSATEGDLIASADGSGAALSSIIIPKGESSVSFYYTGQQAGQFTIRTSSGLVSESQIVTVEPSTVSKQAFVSPPQSIKAGSISEPIRVIFTDEYGNPTSLDSDKQLALSTNCDSGDFSESSATWLSKTSLDVSLGAFDATFYYTDTITGSCILTVTAPGLGEVSQSIVVTAGDVHRVAISEPVGDKIKGDTYTLSLRLLDVYGNMAKAGSDTEVYLKTSSSTGRFDSSTLRFTPGMTSQTFEYTDTSSGEFEITASDQISDQEEEVIIGDSTQVVFAEGQPSSLVINPYAYTVQAGKVQPITVTVLNEFGVSIATPGDISVALSNQESTGKLLDNFGNTASTATIPSGQSSVTFGYTNTRTTTDFITVSSAGLSNANARVSVIPESVYEVRFITEAFTGSRALEAGGVGTLGVELYDVYGNISVTPESITLYATSNSTTGTFSNGGRLVVLAGNSNGNIQYSDTSPGSYQLSISDSINGSGGLGINGDTQAVDVIDGSVATFRFVQSDIRLERGAVSGALTLELLNSSGHVVAAPSGGQAIDLGMSSGTGLFSMATNGNFSSSVSINVPAGKTSANFYYRNDSAMIEDRVCTVSGGVTQSCSIENEYQHNIRARATFDGAQIAKTMNVAMEYGSPAQLVFVTPNRTQQEDYPSSIMTVELQNQYGKPVPVHDDMPLHLRSNALSGEFGSSKLLWGVQKINLLDNHSTADFYYKDSSAGTPMITVADTLPIAPDVKVINATQPTTVTASTGVKRVVSNFFVTNVSDPQQQGTQSSLVVIARDANGYVIDDYDGTVTFTSNDPDAMLPDTYTFSPTVDRGSKTFTNGVAFNTTGEKIVTVTDSENGAIGSQIDITVGGGNTAELAKVVFAQPSPPVYITKNVASPVITIELQDADGNPTIAPLAGTPIRLSSDSASGEFSLTPAGPWLHDMIATVGSGFSFINVYYRDGEHGTSTITTSDWINTSDNFAIENDQLEIIVRDTAFDDGYNIQSQNAFGMFEDSEYLFSHNATGAINGKVTLTANASDLASSEPRVAQWRAQWLQSGVVIKQEAFADRQSIIFKIDDIVTTAGQSDFSIGFEATGDSFADAENVVSRQHDVKVSPWSSSIEITQRELSVGDDSSAVIRFFDNSEPSQPKLAVVQLVNVTDITSDDAADTVAYAEPSEEISYQIPIGILQAGESYRLLVTTFDEGGHKTAQTLSDTVYLKDETVAPEDESSDSDDDGIFLPTPADGTAPQLGEDPVAQGSKPGNNNKGSVRDPNEPPVAISQPDTEPNTIVAAAQLITAATGSTFIVILLLRESYKEFMRVYRLRKTLKKERELAASKATFLSLSAHYLRTPITLLEAATSMAGDSSVYIERIVASLQKHADELLKNGVEEPLQEIENPDITRMTRSALLSIFFWLPVILSVILTLSASVLLNAAMSEVSLNDTLVYSGIIAISLALVVFFGARTIYVNKEKNEQAAMLGRHRTQLFEAKNSFINGLRTFIERDVRELESVIKSHSIAPSAKGFIDDGVNRLNDLISKLTISLSIDGVSHNTESLSSDDLVNQALERYHGAIINNDIQITKRVDSRQGTLQNKRLVAYVMQTLLGGAIRSANRNSRVVVETIQHKDQLEIDVSSSNVKTDLVQSMENIFGNESFSYSDEVSQSSTSLSFFLGKMIMQQIGGSVAIDKTTNNGLKLKLTFQSM